MGLGYNHPDWCHEVCQRHGNIWRRIATLRELASPEGLQTRAEPSNKTTIAVARLKKAASIESVSVRLEYYGPDRGDVVHSLMLNPLHVAIDAAPTLIDVALPKERAVRIIDHLANLGFFDRAEGFDLALHNTNRCH
jgi:hypothetical protein